MNDPRARATSRVAVALGVLCLMASACGSGSPRAGPESTGWTAETTTSTTPSSITTTTTPAAGVEEMAAIVAAMTPIEKARQLVVSGIRGELLVAGIEAAAGSLCLGGVFVTDANHNWQPDDSASAATAALGALAVAAEMDGCVGRPLLMTDAEPGSVLRVPIDPLESAPSLAARYRGHAEEALDALAADGAGFVGALSALGVDVNLGAVADIDVDPTFYMAQRGRTFGDDPAVVAELSAALVDLHCAAGVAAALKHFPNQGASAGDPHTTRNTAADGEEGWTTRGRIPYIGTTAPVVMTGHVFIDTDPERPASLSAAVTTGLLRDQLGFDGVVITDDLFAMQGISDVVPGVSDRAVEAIAAGADLALFVVEDDIESVLTTIADRAADDPIFSARVDESVTRVLALKASLGLVDELDPAWFPLCG